MTDYMEMTEALRAPDTLDRASVLAQLERDHGVSTIRAKLQGEGQDDCDECGVQIPAARRLAAPWAVCCVECASIRERRA